MLTPISGRQVDQMAAGTRLTIAHQVTAVDGGPAERIVGAKQVFLRDQALGCGLHHLGPQIYDAGIDQDPLAIAAEGAGQDAGDGQTGGKVLVIAAHHEVTLRGYLDAAGHLEVHHHFPTAVQLVNKALLNLLPHPVGVLQGIEIDEGGDSDGLGQGRQRLALHQLIGHAGHQPVELHASSGLARVTLIPVDGVGTTAGQGQRKGQRRDEFVHGYLSCICT